MKIDIPTTDGTKFLIIGSVEQYINIDIPYGNDYIGDFTIYIPKNLRFATPISVSLNCQASGRVVTCARSNSTPDYVSGWVQSSCSGPCAVTISLIYWGY